MRPPNKEGFEVYRSFPVIKFACCLFFKLWGKIKNGKSKSHASSTKLSKHEVLNPHRHSAIGGASLSLKSPHRHLATGGASLSFKSSSPYGDRRHRNKVF